MKLQKNRFIAIAAASGALTMTAFAASGTWNTTTSGALWTLNTNWVGSNIADGSGFTADFSQVDITADTTVALDGTRTIGNLVFGDTATATGGSWTLDGGANALTLAGGTPTITVNALGTNKAVVFNTGLTGSNGFTKNGSGTLILQSAGNTLSGAVTLSAGTLQLNNASLTTASSVAINSGTLVVATTLANALGGTISFGGGFLQFNVAPGTDYSAQFSTSANQAYKIITGVSTTFGSNLASSGGSLSLQGSGNLTLSAANTFNGTTTVSTNNGNLILSNALALQNSAIDATNSVTGSATQGLVLSGVTTPTFGGLTGTKGLSTLFNSSIGGYGSVTNLTLNPGTGANYTYSGDIANGASGMSLTKSGAGSQTLSGNNSYTGGTAINSGTLVLGSANAIGTTGTISFGGGTLRAFNTTDYSSRFSTAASQAYNIDTNGQNVTWASGLTSSGGTLTKSGTGTLTLSGGVANTFSGAITVSAGMLGSLNSASLQNITGAITVASGATFDAKANFGGNITKNFILSGTGSGIDGYGALNIRENANLTGSITLNADTLITHDWNIATVSGSVTGTNTSLELKTLQASQFGFAMNGPISLGTGALTLTGIGTSGSADFSLTGTNSYTGGTLLKGGKVSFNNASALGSGTVTFVSNTTLASTATMTQANVLTVNTGITATLEAATSTTLTQSGALTGAGTLAKTGLGAVTLTGGISNTSSGAINVNAGRLNVVDGFSLKNTTGAITVSSGASFNFSQNFGSNNLTNAITLSGSGDGTLGAFHIAGNSTATGGITLAADSTITHDFNNGTIETGAITGLGRNLQLTTTVAGQPGLAINSAIQTGAGRVSVTGAANGGAYSVLLGGNNTFTGGLVINNGVVQLNSTGALNSTAGSENAVTFGASTTTGKLALNGRSYVISNLTSNATPGSPVVENGNATAVTLTVGNSQNLSGTYAGVIQNGTGGGALSLTKSGSGTLTLSGANTYTGATAISSGILVVNGNQSSATGAVSVTGTLAGNGGIIGGNTTVNAGGKLALGDGTAKSIGTETFNGTLAFAATSIFEWDLNAPNTDQAGANQGSYDKVVNNNATKMSGTSVFNVILGTGDSFTDAFWDTNKTWTNVFSGTGLATNLSTIFTSFSGNGIVNTAGVGVVAGQGSFSFNGSTALTWSAVPEPTSALAGLLIGAGLLRRRRR